MKKLILLLSLLMLAQVGWGQQLSYPALSTQNVFSNFNQFQSGIEMGPQVFANLSSLTGFANMVILTDGTNGSNPCTGGGTGALAVYLNGVWNCSVSGSSGGISGLTAGVIPQAGSPTSIINSSPQLDNGLTIATALTYKGARGINIAGDGTHAGLLDLVGNTTAQTLGSNMVALIGPNSASFTSYGLQFSSGAPSNATPLLSCATPSSGISACTWVAAAAGNPCTSVAHSVQYNNGGSFGCTDLTYTTAGGPPNQYSSASFWTIAVTQSGAVNNPSTALGVSLVTTPTNNPTEIGVNVLVQDNGTTSGGGNLLQGILVNTDGNSGSGVNSQAEIGIESITLPSFSATSANTQIAFEGINSDYSGRLTTISERDTFLAGTEVIDGVITTDAAFHVRSPNIGTGGSPTHRYGLLIDDQTGVGSGANPDPHGIVVKGGGIQQTPILFTALPTCNSNTNGETIPITDSNTAVYNANITAGGGGNIVLAYCNGSNWTAH